MEARQPAGDLLRITGQPIAKPGKLGSVRVQSDPAEPDLELIA